MIEIYPPETVAGKVAVFVDACNAGAMRTGSKGDEPLDI